MFCDFYDGDVNILWAVRHKAAIPHQYNFARTDCIALIHSRRTDNFSPRKQFHHFSPNLMFVTVLTTARQTSPTPLNPTDLLCTPRPICLQNFPTLYLWFNPVQYFVISWFSSGTFWAVVLAPAYRPPCCMFIYGCLLNLDSMLLSEAQSKAALSYNHLGLCTPRHMQFPTCRHTLTILCHRLSALFPVSCLLLDAGVLKGHEFW